jgi:hypothetical protein
MSTTMMELDWQAAVAVFPRVAAATRRQGPSKVSAATIAARWAGVLPGLLMVASDAVKWLHRRR